MLTRRIRFLTVRVLDMQILQILESLTKNSDINRFIIIKSFRLLQLIKSQKILGILRAFCIN